MFKSLTLVALIAATAVPALAQSASPTGGRDYQEDVYVTPYWTRRPVIEVLGRAEMEVAPNRAQFSVVYLETDKSANEAMKLVVQRARLAYDTIKKTAGDKARVQTSVDVRPYYEQYRNDDGTVIENTRADKIKGYEARATLNVMIEGDTALAGKARAGALALGPENSSGLNTYLQQTADMTRAAYEAAVADAAARARATAQASGAPLGKLLAAQEGNGPCLGRWSTMAGRTSGEPYGYAMAEPPAPPAPAAKLESFAVASQKIGGQQVTITEADIANLNLPSDDVKQTVSASVCLIYAAGN
jgi:hypothetical protein